MKNGPLENRLSVLWDIFLIIWVWKNSADFPLYLRCVFTIKQALADLVTEKDLAEGRLYPPLSSIREVSLKLAVKVRAQCTHTTKTRCTSQAVRV